MSDNKKYYYIKLKDNYFDQDNVKILESVPNGHIYSLIIVKLYLKATKYGGQLKMTDTIPYDPSKIEILANVLNHDVSHVKEAIKISNELGIISIKNSGDMWMSEIQNFIGTSSTEADRIREYRKGLQVIENTGFVQMYDKSTPELELELELKRDREIELERKKKEEQLKKEKIRLDPKNQKINNMSFILEDKTYFNAIEKDIIEWREFFYKIDVDKILVEISEWNYVNDKKRKTRKGIKRHIKEWLRKENAKAPEPPPKKPYKPIYMDMFAWNNSPYNELARAGTNPIQYTNMTDERYKDYKVGGEIEGKEKIRIDTLEFLKTYGHEQKHSLCK